MSDALKDATPDDLERYAEEMAQWADANALGAKGRAFAVSAALLRAVAKMQRHGDAAARASGEGPDFAAAERAAKCVEDWVPDDEYENTRNLARAYLALEEQVATLTAELRLERSAAEVNAEWWAKKTESLSSAEQERRNG